MFNRILVPLDGSENAEKVLPFVISEAKNHRADVVLLRVIAPLRQSLMTSPNLIAQIYEQVESIANDYLEGIAKKLRAESLDVKIVINKGQPARKIHETAHEESCDLIIIGTHGETGNPQWRSGGVAIKIIRSQSPIPILVITTLSP